ncbi:MAG: TraR/DksA family transcriptional regulator [Candidatus Rokuibacteriota bacterium]
MSETGSALGEEFRRRLHEARAQVARTVAVTGEELASLEDEPGDPLGAVPVQDVANTLSRLEGRERHQLDEIDAALGRLETGTYGVCEKCSSAIPLPRLRAKPTARFCVPCQVSEEAGGPPWRSVP